MNKDYREERLCPCAGSTILQATSTKEPLLYVCLKAKSSSYCGSISGNIFRNPGNPKQNLIFVTIFIYILQKVWSYSLLAT